MRRWLLGVAAGLAAGWAEARFDEHAALRAAARELKLARRHLAAAPHDYTGHRGEAVEQIDRALEQIRQAIVTTGEPEELGEAPE